MEQPHKQKDQIMTYPGGKNGSGVYQTIINKMPPHWTYIEPFLGSGTIMRIKRPARINYGMDLDPKAIECFKEDLEKNNPYNIDADGDSWDGPLYRISHGDGIEFLKEAPGNEGDMIYLDPPYLHETRSKAKIYKHEMSNDQHLELLEIIVKRKGMIMISGYCSDMYHEVLKDWNVTNFPSMTRGGPRTEYLWHNYDIPPTVLHDYSFLGGDYRERERIARRNDRWVERLKSLRTVERNAVIDAVVQEFGEDVEEPLNAYRTVNDGH